MLNHLLVFAKYPEPGRVKTRLAQSVGAERATELYRTMAETVVEQVLPTDHDYDMTLCFDPPEREKDFRQWLPHIMNWIPQTDGDLGQRLRSAFSDAFAQGRQRVIAIGTDCIHIDPPLLRHAFKGLTDHDVVIGPASDGGYYLIGLKADRPQLFEDISWSTEVVFQETIERAKSVGLSIKTLAVLSDIDTWPSDIASTMG